MVIHLIDNFFFFVIFIINVADDLLYDILHGDDPAEAAVLVDQNRDLLLHLLQFKQQRVDILGLRHKIGCTQNRSDVH